MSQHSQLVSTIFMDKVADWLTKSALAGNTLEQIVSGFCDRIAATGIPIHRIHLSFAMLHPLYDALGFTWRPSTGLIVERYVHDIEKPEVFLRSPYYKLLTSNLEFMRRRIPAEGPVEFPVFEDLRKENINDYIAFVQPLGNQSSQGMIGSWSTASEQGFSEDVIAALMRIQDHLAVAAKVAVLDKLANNLLTTYLGEGAGKRVLNGQIRRGDGETVRAALVMGDIRQSTQIADTEGRQAYIDTLNEFFDAAAQPFNRNGGEIVSFVGDGFLAVYPCGRHKDTSEIACRLAFEAVRHAQARMTELNRLRRDNNQKAIGYGIGLHIGNVMFGNVGLRDRLTFSAFGSSVNEVERLQAFTKKYSSQVIASDAFASYCGGNWKTLGEEELRGVGHKVTLRQPELQQEPVLVDALARDLSRPALSEAERVILLHRDASKTGEKKNGFLDRWIQ
ncbi:adenylate/guanylate cyclase domain-containing protein [Rhizobium sp. CECT 9324]|jgi:adenylate cyclase|uniref:adenylate/guanylate cyclase domain-containing protein n=1 Tax=Rhizobium sp. CECT 9324 TaxID=2845820 RepID=UPI000DDE3976|nr:adenylate/guanylate cyclase domain-containing protein [Rhizobium sp. CECT 9324]CAH0342246.1 hypothetical protein RHI9324_03963 [Rhizobium sp. CECT 9324]